MYGKTHNNITYNGIAAIKVGEKSTNLTNNEVTLSSDTNIDISIKDNSISFGLKEADNYVKKDDLKNYTSHDEVMAVEENGIIVDRKIRIGGKDYILIDEDYYKNIIKPYLAETYLTIAEWGEVKYASQDDLIQLERQLQVLAIAISALSEKIDELHKLPLDGSS